MWELLGEKQGERFLKDSLKEWRNLEKRELEILNMPKAVMADTQILILNLIVFSYSLLFFEALQENVYKYPF